MKAGEKDLEYSVSPFETDIKTGDGEDNGVEEIESDGEDLKMETGEVCERIKLEEDGAVINK